MDGPQEMTDVEMEMDEDMVCQLREKMFRELDDLIWYLNNKRGMMSDRYLGSTDDRQMMYELIGVTQLKLKAICAARQEVITEESRQGVC